MEKKQTVIEQNISELSSVEIYQLEQHARALRSEAFAELFGGLIKWFFQARPRPVTQLRLRTH